jgi:hypothetical protein
MMNTHSETTERNCVKSSAVPIADIQECTDKISFYE